MSRRSQDPAAATIVMRLAGAIAHGAPLDYAAAREPVEVPAEKVEATEAIYRVASLPRGLGLRRGDFLVVEPRENHAATAELVVAVLTDRVFVGRWWGKHGRRAVMDEDFTPFIEDAAVRVLGVVTVVMRRS